MTVKGILCAVEAGTFAAFASVSAKLATSSTAASNLSHLFVDMFDFVPVDQVSVILRVVGVVAMFLCNALMWTQFTKSMHLCSSVLEATAFNVAANFLSTAFLGCILFGEAVGVQWYAGSVCIILGLLVLHKGGFDDLDSGSLDQSHADQSGPQDSRVSNLKKED